MKLGLVAHMYQEELLLPQWVKWHREIFDVATIIDHHSKDNSISIVRELAPHWKVISSRNERFDAYDNDREVSETEHKLKEEEAPDWMMALNITEQIFTPCLKEKLKLLSNQAPDIQAFGMRSFCMVDPAPNDSLNVLRHSYGYMDYEKGINGARRWRFIHNWLWGNYELGRHGTALRHTTCPELLIAYWQLAPYPLCRERKLQIKAKAVPEQLAAGLGQQHNIDGAGLDRVYRLDVERSYNLNELPLYREYADYWRGARL